MAKLFSKNAGKLNLDAIAEDEIQQEAKQAVQKADEILDDIDFDFELKGDIEEYIPKETQEHEFTRSFSWKDKEPLEGIFLGLTPILYSGGQPGWTMTYIARKDSKRYTATVGFQLKQFLMDNDFQPGYYIYAEQIDSIPLKSGVGSMSIYKIKYDPKQVQVKNKLLTPAQARKFGDQLIDGMEAKQKLLPF